MGKPVKRIKKAKGSTQAPMWDKQARTMRILQSRRDTIYKMKTKRNDGICPCYVCGKHVELKNATLEHIVDRSAGGTNAMGNLDISHAKCNHERERMKKVVDNS